MSAFDWIQSFGNELAQGTSPYPTDAGNGSTLRMSEPNAAGEIWVAAVTKGAIDPDGAGGIDAAGNTASRNLFLFELGADGTLLSFRGYRGDLVDIDDSLSVGAVVRLNGDAIAVVGTFRGGSLDLGDAGIVTQSSQTTDDAFVARFDGTGKAVAARQLGGANAQTARSAVFDGARIVVAGKLKRIMKVTDPVTAFEDAACAFSQGTEDFERATVLELDPATLACSHLVTFGATDVGAAQQAWAVWADASGVYVAGGFTRQIIGAPLAAVPASASEDGFVAALEPDLATPMARFVARATSNRNSAVDSLRAVYGDGTRLYVGGFFDRGTSMVGGLDPEVGVPGGVVCNVGTPNGRDGLLGVLDAATGACTAATLVGGADEDEVHTLAASPGGVALGGFTTNGIAGLDTSLGGGSRDGFVARMTPILALQGGATFGGTSWDYLDGARISGRTLYVAGSFDTRFDVLDGQADFFVGALPAP
ncbi:MAG TPA: hypothetical protein VL400_07700 [Polyangiaceae bacterium]|nr:hypothetical protein [Polyangiaceae bacterium]